jgi:hypothetical protein
VTRVTKALDKKESVVSELTILQEDVLSRMNEKVYLWRTGDTFTLFHREDGRVDFAPVMWSTVNSLLKKGYIEEVATNSGVYGLVESDAATDNKWYVVLVGYDDHEGMIYTSGQALRGLSPTDAASKAERADWEIILQIFGPFDNKPHKYPGTE